MGVFWEILKRPFMRKTMTSYDEGEYYTFIDYGRYGVGIEILHGKYKGVVYTYGEVKFEELDGSGVLHIEFDIITPGKYDPLKLRSDSDFIVIIGDILTGIIIKQGANG